MRAFRRAVMTAIELCGTIRKAGTINLQTRGITHHPLRCVGTVEVVDVERRRNHKPRQH